MEIITLGSLLLLVGMAIIGTHMKKLHNLKAKLENLDKKL